MILILISILTKTNTLNFHALDVFLILKGINAIASKAAGPDDIHGIVLKSCAASLAKPLSDFTDVPGNESFRALYS